jgi:hypothetical protein
MPPGGTIIELFVLKSYMGRDHRGRPSGTNKSEGTGLRPNMPPEELKKDQEITDKYMEGEDKVADNVPVRHPNRNTDKPDATNAGGYKS